MRQDQEEVAIQDTKPGKNSDLQQKIHMDVETPKGK